MNVFALRLRQLRQERKLRQKDIAQKLGITESAYGYYEQGRREPTYETLQQLADYFEVTTDYLLGRVDHPEKTKNDLEKALATIPDLSQTDPSQVPVELFLEVLKIKKPTIDGRPIPEEKKALIIAQLEATLEILRKQQNGGSKDE